jgi:hypothetical protein
MKILTLSDASYKLAEFDQKIAAEVLTWAKTKLPDPIEELKKFLNGFSATLQAIMVKEAMLQARIPKSIDSPEVQGLIKSPEGLEKVMFLMFHKYQPDLTIEDIWKIHHQAVRELGENYVEGLPSE